MAFPELHVFAADDVNGTPIETIPFTNAYLEAVSIRVALREIGSMNLRLSRQYAATLADSSVFTADNFCRLLVPAISTTRYFGGGFMGDQVRQLVARIAAGEDVSINLLGPAWYLSRAILWDEQFSQDADQPYRIDLINGVFRFEGDADAGNVLKRLQREDSNNTIAEFIPDMTITFDQSVDSNGDAWTNPVGSPEDPFTLPIGQTFLDDTFAVFAAVPTLDMTWDLGTVATPKLEMSVWQGLTGYGRDLTPASVSDFASDVVHFKKGKNIAGDVVFHSAGRRKATHALAIGSDGKYGRAVRASYSAGGYARAIAIERGNLHWEPALDRAAQRYLAHQQLGENEYALAHYPGFAPTDGLYMPGPHSTSGHYWIGDSVGLTTYATGSATPIDLAASSELVTGVTLDMRNVVKDGDATEGALSWNVVADLNVERSSASAPSSETAGTSTSIGCKCHPIAPECPPTAADSTLIDWDWSPCSDPSFTDAMTGGGAGNPWGDGSLGDWDAGFCNSDVGPKFESMRWAVTAGTTMLLTITSAKLGSPSGTANFSVRYYTAAHAFLSQETQTFSRGWLSHEGGDHGTWVTDSGSFVVPVTAAYASIQLSSTYLSYFVQHITAIVPAAAATPYEFCIDYGSWSHDYPNTLPSDYVIDRLDDLQDQITDRAVDSQVERVTSDLHGTFLRVAHSDADNDPYILTSQDGLAWQYLNNGDKLFEFSTGSTRDPSLLHYDGSYWIAHTGPSDLEKFTIWHSDELTTGWTQYVQPSCSSINPGPFRVWAPEWFIDSDGSAHIFFAASNTGFTDFQLYEIHPTDREMTTWSTPVQITGTSLAANMIDPFMVKRGDTYYLWYKQETDHYIEYMQSTSLTSGYTVTESGDWAGWGAGIEAVCVVPIDNDRWRMYCVENSGFGTVAAHYSDSTDDWATWSALGDLTDPLLLSHGTVLRLPSVYDIADQLTDTGADLAAHIADTSDAHDASAVSIVDSGAYYTGTDVEAALQEVGASLAAGTGSSQHILLADGRSTPFTFNDLLQMDDGSDFMWSDPA